MASLRSGFHLAPGAGQRRLATFTYRLHYDSLYRRGKGAGPTDCDAISFGFTFISCVMTAPSAHAGLTAYCVARAGRMRQLRAH